MIGTGSPQSRTMSAHRPYARPDDRPPPGRFPYQSTTPRVAARRARSRAATWLRAALLALAALSAILAATSIDSAQAALNCNAPADLPPENLALGPRHHPVGRPLPQQPTFRQPRDCSQGVWFYDDNQNHRADPEEPQLYGSDRMLACGSCHAQSDIAQTAITETLFLRQDASKLCLVCHNL